MSWHRLGVRSKALGLKFECVCVCVCVFFFNFFHRPPLMDSTTALVTGASSCFNGYVQSRVRSSGGMRQPGLELETPGLVPRATSLLPLDLLLIQSAH